MDDSNSARRRLQEAGRYLITHRLTWGNAGNMSVRTAPDHFLITASGSRLGELELDDFVEMGPDGPLARGGPRPSKETPMHAAVYQTRPEVNAVIHAAPFYSTLLSCTTVDIPGDWFVEAMYYLERVARVPYHHPGSVSLGEAVREKAAEANVLLLNNHGVLVYDSSLSEALMGTHTLELTCQMLVTARSAGLPVEPLAPDVVRDFLNNSGYRPPRQWPPTAGERS